MNLLLVGGIIIAVLSTGIAIQTKRVENCKSEYARFVAEVKTLGEAAQIKAKAKEAADLKAKEKADVQAKKLRTANAALARQLRDARASSRFVPPAAPASRRPHAACFSRAELERALQRLDDEISSIVAEGDTARIDLGAAQEWAKEVSSSGPPLRQ